MKTQQILSSVLLGVLFLELASSAETRKAFEAVSIRPEDPRGSTRAVASQGRPVSALVAQSFEVASIRPNNSGPAGLAPLQVRPNGSVFASNVPLRGLIMFAYGLEGYESIEGGGELIEERFDINAKAAKASGITVRSQLLQLARSVKK